MSFSINFEIEGEKQISADLVNVNTKIKNFKSVFEDIGDLLITTFEDNFDTEGETLGEPWDPLATSTIRDKEKKGFGDKPILQRTGDLKDGFKAKAKKTSLLITNREDYFAYHQSNKPRTKLPRRVMMKIDDQRRREIFRAFQEYILISKR